MRWSWKIARIAGIGLYVHATFPFLLLYVGLSQFRVRQDWRDVAIGIAFVLTLFAIVVLHELGHSLTARRFGIATKDITLLPIGGVARLERMPESPRQELLIALAGPAVNVCLAVFFFAIMAAGQQLADLANFRMTGHSFLASLVLVNVTLALFNLLPAFPMDGGRVLRALLAMRISYVRATAAAARVGQIMALGFALVGFLSLVSGFSLPFANPLLLVIALFVYVGAAQEVGMVQTRSELGGMTVGQLMIRDFASLPPDAPVGRAVELFFSGWQQDFPVVAQGMPIGLLTRDMVTAALAEGGQSRLAGEVMLRPPPVVEAHEPLGAAYVRLRTGAADMLLVTENGQLRGLLTREALSRYLMVRAALKTDPNAVPPAASGLKETRTR